MKNIITNISRKEQVLLLAFLFLLFPFPVDNLKFIVINLASVFAIFELFKEQKAKRINLSLFLFLPFLIFGFISFFWATNPSWTILSTFVWLSLYLFAFFLIEEKSKGFVLLFSFIVLIFFLFGLAHHLAAIQFNITQDVAWNKFLWRNKNYTIAFLSCLFPYFLFLDTQSRFLTFLKFTGLIFLICCVVLTNHFAGIIAIIITVLFFLCEYFNFGQRIIWTMVLLGFVGSLLALTKTNLRLEKVPIYYEFLEQTNSRKYMFDSSIQLFANKPIYGHGLGNWHLLAYQRDLSDVSPFNNDVLPIRLRSHNLFTKILAELGVFGLVLFLIPILIILLAAFKNFNKLTSIQYASLTTFNIYLLYSGVFATANSHDYFFSGIHFMGLISFGFLCSLVVWKIKLNNYILILMLGLSLICFGWAVFSKYAMDQFLSAQQNLASKEYDLAIEQILDIYHPNIRTFHNRKNSLELILAQSYAQIGNIELAIQYYERAVSNAPYDESVQISYAEFLITHKIQLNQARALIDKVLKVQNNHKKALKLNARMSE